MKLFFSKQRGKKARKGLKNASLLLFWSASFSQTKQDRIGLSYNGSPSQGSEHPRMFWSPFAPPYFRVLSGINRFLINENRFWNWFSKQNTRKIQNTPVQTSFRYLKTGSATGLYRKVFENVTGAKWRRNILGRSNPWEGDQTYSQKRKRASHFQGPPVHRPGFLRKFATLMDGSEGWEKVRNRFGPKKFLFPSISKVPTSGYQENVDTQPHRKVNRNQRERSINCKSPCLESVRYGKLRSGLIFSGVILTFSSSFFSSQRTNGSHTLAENHSRLRTTTSWPTGFSRPLIDAQCASNFSTWQYTRLNS